MLKISSHVHTVGRSPCGKVEPKVVVKAYKDAGYDGLIVTNHYMKEVLETYYPEGTLKEHVQYFLEAYRETKRYGEELGLAVHLGMELNLDRYNESGVYYPVYEYLVFGLTEEFLEEHADLYDLSQEQAYELFSENGMAMCQTHPFRGRTKVSNPKYMHGVEIFNGHPHHESRNELAEIFADENHLLKTAGDDYHEVGFEGHAGILVPDECKTISLITKALLEGRTGGFRRDGSIFWNEPRL